MKLIEFIGIVGAIIVTYSNLPQIVLFIKQGHAKGISLSSTWLGLIGIIFRATFLFYTVGMNLIIFIPYFFAIFCCVLTLYYIYRIKEE